MEIIVCEITLSRKPNNCICCVMHVREMCLPTLADDSNSCFPCFLFLEGIISNLEHTATIFEQWYFKKNVRHQTQRVKPKPNNLDHKVQTSFPHFSKLLKLGAHQISSFYTTMRTLPQMQTFFTFQAKIRPSFSPCYKDEQ